MANNNSNSNSNNSTRGGAGSAGRGRGGFGSGIPTGPASMRGGQFGPPFAAGFGGSARPGGRAPSHGFFHPVGNMPAHGGDVSGRGGNANAGTLPKQLDPELYKAPAKPYFEQQDVGDVGTATKCSKCLRCGASRTNHPRFEDCPAPCTFCRSGAHQGLPCPKLWCSESWWKTHWRGPGLPTNVQFRPSESQRERLAKLDNYFANFPPMYHPQEVGAGRKRKAAEEDFEEVPERARFADERDYYKRALDVQGDRLQSHKRARLTAELELKKTEIHLKKTETLLAEANLNIADFEKSMQTKSVSSRVSEQCHTPNENTPKMNEAGLEEARIAGYERGFTNGFIAGQTAMRSQNKASENGSLAVIQKEKL